MTPEHQPRMNFIRGGSLEKQFAAADGHSIRNNRESRGGSLERKFTAAGGGAGAGWSDSEYGRMLGSPMASRRNNNAGSSNSGSSPNSPNSPATGKRDPVFGSRSLPKGTSSLNYGLMLDKLQQKRQQRQQKNDGSMSDSNYATYGELKQRSPYSWLQPASTYAASLQQENGYLGLYGRIGENHESSTISGVDPMGSSESLTSVTSSIQQARANSLTKARLMMHQRNISPRSSLKRGGAMSETSYGGDTASTAAGSDTEYYGIPSLLQRENSASVIARDGFISRVSVIFGLILSYLTRLAT